MSSTAEAYWALVKAGKCPRCYTPKAEDDGYRMCPTCRERVRIRALERLRRMKGRPMDGVENATNRQTPPSRDRWKRRPTECERCSDDVVPDTNLCAEHTQLLAQIDDERKRGLWSPGEEADEW